MQEQEIWKDIPGYEGLYQVSNLGNVKGLPSRRVYSDGRVHYYPERVLKQHTIRRNNKQVCLTVGGNHRSFRVHRLVAMAFLPNPNNYDQVNHKDENPSNNNIDNLEWCSAEYNLNYGTRNKRASESRGKVVLQYSFDGELLREFSGAREAARQMGLEANCGANIQNCCNGKRRSAYGYVWQWKYPSKYVDKV